MKVAVTGSSGLIGTALAASLRADLEEMVASYFENNTVRQDFLVSRAVKL